MQRLAALLPRQLGQPAHRLEDAAEAGAAGERPALAEGGQPQDQQARVDAVQHLRPQPPLLQRAGAEILDQHVHVADQVEQDLTPLGRAHVEREALLSAVGDLPVERHALLHRGERTQRVAAVGQLQLHHFGAQVGAERGAHRGGEHGRHVEDADAGERLGGVGHGATPIMMPRPAEPAARTVPHSGIKRHRR